LTYFIFYLLLYPLLFILSFFRKKSSKNLIIQTAKIGDYVNTTIMFEPLKETDIVIDKINYPFAKNESKVNNIFIISDLKRNKFKAVFTLFFNNYENIYVMMPNSFNTFLASLGFARNKTILQTYSIKWYVKLLSLGFRKVIHTKENLTLDSYVKMINANYSHKNFSKTLPLIPSNTCFDSNSKVGISLSAGNKLKTIDKDTWKKIFSILSNFNISIYFFGVKEEEKYLIDIIPLLEKYNLNYISLLGQTKLENLPFEISQMNLYISSDTGNSYIADTFNIPLINFAGPCYMKEQRPIGENVLIVESNAPCVPFSFIFNAPYETLCNNLYEINKTQELKIKNFLTRIYKGFQSLSS
jgi:ADP-heptose:LPS heptosyltransferase